MLNLEIQKEIDDILAGIPEIKVITRTWSKDYEDLPLAFYTISGNSASIITQEGEDTSRIQATVHIFAKTRDEADAIITTVDRAMTEDYWSRTTYNHSSEKYEHVQASWIVEVDLLTNEHFIAI